MIHSSTVPASGRVLCVHCTVFANVRLHCFVRYTDMCGVFSPLLQELLSDPSVVVRVTGVVGVCRVFSYFWEMVPAAVIKSLLIRLIRDLAWDASAIGVRVAVLQVGWTLSLRITVNGSPI